MHKIDIDSALQKEKGYSKEYILNKDTIYQEYLRIKAQFIEYDVEFQREVKKLKTQYEERKLRIKNLKYLFDAMERRYALCEQTSNKAALIWTTMTDDARAQYGNNASSHYSEVKTRQVEMHRQECSKNKQFVAKMADMLVRLSNTGISQKLHELTLKLDVCNLKDGFRKHAKEMGQVGEENKHVV